MTTAPVSLVATSTGGASHTTGSLTPAANSRILVFGVCTRAAALVGKPSISDNQGGTITWTELGDKHTSNTTNRDIWIVGWISNDLGASPPTGVAITIAGTNAVSSSCFGYTIVSADTSGSATQVASGEDLTAGDAAFTFGSAPGASTIVIGCSGAGSSSATTPPSGYTELDDLQIAGLIFRVETFYDISSAAQGPVNITSGATRAVILAIELAAAGGGAPQTLTASLFDDSADTFHAATIVPGVVTLTPGILVDGDSFLAPTITVGPVALTPAHLDDSIDTFHSATVQPGIVTLTPSLFDDSVDTFHVPAIVPGIVLLTPSWIDDSTDTFYGPTITQGGGAPIGLTPPLLDDSIDTFYPPSVAPGIVSLTPSFLDDSLDTFFAPAVSVGAVTLSPVLVSDGDTFYAPVVSGGVVAPPEFSRERVVRAPVRASRVAAAPLRASRTVTAPARAVRTVTAPSRASRIVTAPSRASRIAVEE